MAVEGGDSSERELLYCFSEDGGEHEREPPPSEFSCELLSELERRVSFPDNELLLAERPLRCW